MTHMKHGYGYSILVKHKIDTSTISWLPYGGDILMYIYVCVCVCECMRACVEFFVKYSIVYNL